MTARIEIVEFRRKEKTDYRKRLRLLMARKPRLVIRRSVRYIYVQAVKYSPAGDNILFTVSSKSLEKLGWKAGQKNLPAAYLTGLLAGKKAKELGISNAILDIGLHHAMKGGRIFAALKGIVDAGIAVPHSKDILPDENRVLGKHIIEYVQSTQKEKNNTAQFSVYAKNNVQFENLPKMFSEMKSKIMGM